MFLINKIKIFLFFPVLFVFLLCFGIKEGYKFGDNIFKNFTVITQANRFDLEVNNVEFLTGVNQSFVFKAKNNNLGIVSLRFDIHNRVNTSSVFFKIKEYGASDWYYINEYETSKFQDGKYSPFGFPEIFDSKNKKYQVEIESIDGTNGNSVTLLAKDNIFLSKYSFPKEYLLQDKTRIFGFAVSRVLSFIKYLSGIDYVLAILISISLLILDVPRIMKFLFSKLYLLIKIFYLWIRRVFIKDPIVIFFAILLLTIFSRYFVSYKNSEVRVNPPELISWLSPVGRDFYTGAMLPTQKMLQKEYFIDEVAVYGTAVTTTLALFLNILQSSKVCNLLDILPCHLFLYKWYLVISTILFLLFIIILFLKRQKTRFLILLLVSIFILQMPFSFVVERGNLDLILFVLIGFLFYFRLNHNIKNGVLKSIFIGLFVGYLTNVKIFLLPFAFIEIFFSGNILFAFLSFVISFVGFSYLPVLYGVNTNVASILTAALSFKNGSDGNFSAPFYLSFNHSIKAISTLFTNCTVNNTCLMKRGIASFISKFWFLFVFVLPFFRSKIINFKKGYRSVLYFLSSLWKKFVNKDKNLYILMYILSVAIINLLPTSVYMYRLVYSFPILLVLIGETEKSSSQRKLLLKSFLSLMINGLWFFNQLSSGFSLFDVRVKNIFILLHFYYLIRLGLEKINEKK